ncbi:hypothetical protein FSB08_26300 [Paraburkholderia sp. JPY432]|uniref:His/Gly/Thr/Pro-type tRNA ligase C-terminal domain-containing protein n=1 Tax=Paraburkholderia youngii TaxID=2782701 RepID=UPI001595DCE1|nr:His/Gly/Thr/Pro-type tRNA ligase C-terminal domain-containing protein [Paraburkholderia youngii]NVH75949.1 hypothetical protein [Paraburkholderia youngii]
MRVCEMLDDAGLCVIANCRAKRLERKIVDARELQILLMIVFGSRDECDLTVSLRKRNGDKLTLRLEETVTALAHEAQLPDREICQRPCPVAAPITANQGAALGPETAQRQCPVEMNPARPYGRLITLPGVRQASR